MSVNIKYKNNSIATLTDTGTKTLKTSGKYCEADIIVENTKDGGSNELFHAEVTPATGGEVLTFEVGEIGERIAGVIVSVKVETTTATKFNNPIKEIAAINTRQGVSSRPLFDNLIVYKSGGMQEKSTKDSAQNYDSTPDGSDVNKVYNIWNSESVKPWVKLYITNGSEAKYGLLVGDTYDIWVIKAG